MSLFDFGFVFDVGRVSFKITRQDFSAGIEEHVLSKPIPLCDWKIGNTFFQKFQLLVQELQPRVYFSVDKTRLAKTLVEMPEISHFDRTAKRMLANFILSRKKPISDQQITQVINIPIKVEDLVSCPCPKTGFRARARARTRARNQIFIHVVYMQRDLFQSRNFKASCFMRRWIL